MSATFIGAPFRSSDASILRAIAAAWPNARLVELRGVGHHRILRAREVISGTAEFLAAGASELSLRPAQAS